MEDFEREKDDEVEEVRGANISLKNRLSRLEQQLRKKDELAENLHIIDFEQLKIENQVSNGDFLRMYDIVRWVCCRVCVCVRATGRR